MADASSSQQNRLLLAAWGLPTPVLAAFGKKGLKQLYPWQAAALDCAAAGNNLVYCAPTSGGKSLVAEVLMLARLHRMQQAVAVKGNRRQQPLPRGLLVLPYLSIVSEKTTHLSQLLSDMKWKVQGYRGETEGQPLGNKSERIAICSIEKANMAINHLIQEQRLHELVSVVVDEAHMLADPHRGAALEMLLSKLVACRALCSVQIVAMSATMTGLDSLSSWLDAHLFLTNFRPVPLTEHAVFDSTVFVKADGAGVPGSDADGRPLVEQRKLPVSSSNDKETLLALVAEVVTESHSVLVFCAGRGAAQNCASLLADNLAKRLGPPSAQQVAARADLVEQLRVALAGSTNARLEHMIAAGVAYHHAGLTHQERGVVEEGYRSGALLVLTATSTLAAGVNLPARRVILRSLWQGGGNVGRAQYLQMVGRAGRAGQSAVGESFLMGTGAAGSATGQWDAVCRLMSAPLPVLNSQLVSQEQPHQPRQQERQPAGAGGDLSNAASNGPQGADSSGPQGAGSGGTQGTRSGGPQQPASSSNLSNAQPMLQQLLLHGVATGLVNTGQSVLSLLQSTLAYHQVLFDDLAAAARTALAGLRARRLISLKPEGPSGPAHWELTPLGSAVVASTLPPDLGLLLHSRLSDLMSCLVMGGHVHLLYVLQPDPLFAIYDWNLWCRMAKEMTKSHKRIAEVEGVDLSYVDRRIAGMRSNPTADAKHARLAAAILLDWLIADAGQVHLLEEVWGQPNSLTKAGISRGQMQAWQLEISKTAAMAALLASKAGWWQLEILLAPLAAQAAAGVKPELLPLMDVAGMQPAHASALHAAGFVRPELLLCASESEVAAALAAKLPANMRKRKDMDKRGLAVGATGSYGTNALVTRAARSILAAARQHAVLGAASLGDDDDDGQRQQAHPQQLARVIVGQASVHQVWPHQDDPLLQKLLDSWYLQPSFSLAVITHQQQCATPGCQACAGSDTNTSDSNTGCHHEAGRGSHAAAAAAGSGGPAAAAAAECPPCTLLHCQQATALVVCWADREAAVLHLPDSSAGSSPTCSQVWATVRSVFADTTRTATCCGSAAAIAALQATGIECRLTVDDPCVAFLLWQPKACNQLAAQQQGQQNQQEYQGQQQQQHWQPSEVMKAAHSLVLGNTYKVQVPLVGGNHQAAAVRAALLARALMPPLRAVLAREQLSAVYETVERPLQRVCASVRAAGVRVATAAVQQQLQQCEWRLGELQKQAAALIPGRGRVVDVSSQSQVRQLLTQLRLASGRARKDDDDDDGDQRLEPMPALLLQAQRTALRLNRPDLLPLLQCLHSYWRITAFQQELSSALRCAVNSNASSSNNSSSSSAAPQLVDSSMHVLLQPLPHIAALCGDVGLGLPEEFSSLLSPAAVAALPVAVAEGSLADFGINSLAAAMPVVACLPVQQQQQQQQQVPPVLEVLGTLCSLNQAAPGHMSDSQLPLSGFDSTGAQANLGCVRHWCNASQCVREVQLCTSALHAVQQQASLAMRGSSVSYVSSALSMLAAAAPNKCDHTFIGLQLEQLPLLVLAAVSQDPVLLAALSQPDPLAAAAEHWLANAGLKPQVSSLLLSRVAAGVLDGVPVPSPDVARALFCSAVDALVLGHKPSVQRTALGLDKSVGPLNLAWCVLQAFPGLTAWHSGMLQECRRTGYLQSLLGRKLPFKLPPSGTSSKEAKALKEAERLATSLGLLACCGDVERLAAAALHRFCSGRSSSGSPNCSTVVCGQRLIVLEVPSSQALPFLRAAAPEVNQQLSATLGVGSTGLPFRWWWGSSLDAAQGNQFVA